MLAAPHASCSARAATRGRSGVAVAVRASVQQPVTTPHMPEQQQVPAGAFGRRNVLLGAAASALLLGSERGALATPADDKKVGAYLPPAGVEDFVEFVPPARYTPSLRAGTVDASNPYQFAIPPAWSEERVSNTQSGNYCQPRCDEPWTEVIFSNPGEGRMQLIVSPLKKLTPRGNVKIEELGTPSQLLERIGNFITGTYLDEEEVVSTASKPLGAGGQSYYIYEINAPYGKVGPHTLTSVTTKGDLLYLFVVSANDKQWIKNEGRLRKVVETFRA